MKIVLFFTLFFLIFGSSGYYVYLRLTRAFAGTFVSGKWFAVLYIFLMLSFIIGKTVEHYSIGTLSHVLVGLGAVTLGVFFYALLFTLFIDLLRLINGLITFFPAAIRSHPANAAFYTGLFGVAVVLLVFARGYYNAYSPRLTELELKIHKPAANFDTLNVVAVSDIHLGTMVNESKLTRLIRTVNSLNPDLMIIAGDNVDNNIKVVKHDRLLEYFKEINTRYGIFSCLGNHEYISGAQHYLGYFEQNGIRMLRDSVVELPVGLYIIGRDDVSAYRHSTQKRKSLDELTENIDFDKAVIVLDHQPYRLDKTAALPVDFQFSGHTHNGQIWPLNYVTHRLFEKSWGYLRKGTTHFYVSAGFGTALIPIRLASQSEVVHIRIINEK
jgi:predicted MPP superfamily phosphohydrolase